MDHKKIQYHEEEVKRILKENDCMDSQGRIRKWTRKASKAWNKNAHTSWSVKR